MDAAAEIAARVEITDRSTGAARVLDMTWDGEVGEYLWSDGNYGCDCNRARFFAEAGGESEPEDAPCGEERYAVRITREDGGVLYEDERP